MWFDGFREITFVPSDSFAVFFNSQFSTFFFFNYSFWWFTYWHVPHLGCPPGPSQPSLGFGLHLPLSCTRLAPARAPTLWLQGARHILLRAISVTWLPDGLISLMMTHCRDAKFAVSSKCFEVFLLTTVLIAVMVKTTKWKGTSWATQF